MGKKSTTEGQKSKGARRKSELTSIIIYSYRIWSPFWEPASAGQWVSAHGRGSANGLTQQKSWSQLRVSAKHNASCLSTKTYAHNRTHLKHGPGTLAALYSNLIQSFWHTPTPPHPVYTLPCQYNTYERWHRAELGADTRSQAATAWHNTTSGFFKPRPAHTYYQRRPNQDTSKKFSFEQFNQYVLWHYPKHELFPSHSVARSEKKRKWKKNCI